MTKFKQEEYEVLKGADDIWNWIARDKDGTLFVYKYKPYRLATLWNFDEGVHDPLREDNLFQFIQWEDEEPHNIAELIEEYEDEEYGYFNMKLSREFEKFIEESEETEVKKDLKWFVDKWAKERNKTDVHDPMYHFINEFIADVNQLDEPEVLSRNWISENITESDIKGNGYVAADALYGILVPEQEEVDQAYKDGYEKGKQHATEKQSEETETVAGVLVDYLIASAKLKLALSMEVEELEE